MNKHTGPLPRGLEILHDPLLNKGTAFTEAERDALGLRGLLPPHVLSIEQQLSRVMQNLRQKHDDLERFVFMAALQNRNETLFYRALLDHLDELMPIIYTPTVGKACQGYGQIFRRPRGIFVSAEDAGRVSSILRNWPQDDVRVIVVTDGERILGLGDLGANGMGIPVGKLALYTACAGIHPSACLPVTIDVGTENEKLMHDPIYIGLQQRRVRGAAYDQLIDEFMTAAQARYPRALIQFEDFASQNAFRLLKTYKDRVCTFNDDIQGTAAVALAGLYTAIRITKQPLAGQRVLFLGAGEAGTGIADLIVAAMVDEGASEAEARRRCWFIDSKGLVVKSRADLAEHKIPYAHNFESQSDFVAIIDSLRPTALIGVSAQGGAFTGPVLQRMAEINDRPIIFALSNPTSKAECTAEAAYVATDCRCVFASGSPFSPVTVNGKTFVPGQGNNAYIFPGVGLGVVASGSRLVTDEMFLAAARVLAREVADSDIEVGRIYPPFSRIRDVSAAIALATAEVAYARGLATQPRPDDLLAHLKAQMFQPVYRCYV